MVWTTIHIIEIILWFFMAGSVFYVLFFAFASLLPSRRRSDTQHDGSDNHLSFLVLFPAYGEDRVIVNSVENFLKQDYPTDKFHIAVISDHMTDNTNENLDKLPISVFRPLFDKSSKAKALQFAMSQTEKTYDYVVILDADNIVNSDFLHRLNTSCKQGYLAIQCHRCAKNTENSIAMLDSVSEEINNTVFRKAHNRIGLSSALIGSGMCFSFGWFRANVNHLSTAGEDRELEALLLQQRIFIRYEEDIHVFDEKVSNEDNFQRQRLRWMSAQISSLLSMLPKTPRQIITGNIDFVDKTIQQMLLPRSILLLGTAVMAVIMFVIANVWCAKWWILFVLLCLAMFLSIPSSMRTRSIFSRVTALPRLVLKMLNNIKRIDKNSKDFIHTKHEK
ncbi:MAG: glycosyltransferase [Prevotella sp.]